MAAPSFDATRAVQFDLGRGSVRTGGEQECVLLVPSNALAQLIAAAPPDAGTSLGLALGGAIGRRARGRLPDADMASIEDAVTQLAGEAALAGIGSLSIERWGRAVVVVIQGSPLPSVLLAPLVAAALEAAFAQPVGSTLLSGDAPDARVLVASPQGIERVRGWLASGVSWGDALTRLQGGAA